MYNRHNEIPELRSRSSQVEAHYFNHAQRALIHLGNEVRLEIPEFVYLDLILQKNAWIIVDPVLHDYPIAAWCEFNVDHRDNLHQGIDCTLRTFHCAANMVLRRTLDAMEQLLIAELTTHTLEEDARIIPFKK